ncbi:MAG: hypothetical protein U0793_25005 [Gemmataceae bacterium]
MARCRRPEKGTQLVSLRLGRYHDRRKRDRELRPPRLDHGDRWHVLDLQLLLRQAVLDLRPRVAHVHGQRQRLRRPRLHQPTRIPASTASPTGRIDKRDSVTEINRYSDLTGTTLVARSDYTYAPNGFLAAIDHLNASSATIDYFHYSQDAANRVTSEESKVSGVSSTRNFTYDNINQLLSDGSSTYAFDKQGRQ